MRYIGKLTGKVEAVLICSLPDSLASLRRESLQLELDGILGDKHSGHIFPSNGRYPEYKRGTLIRNSRQISIISQEEMQAVAAALSLPAIEPEWLGANLYLSGIPSLTLLPPSSRLFFESGSVLVVHGENDPCTGPGDILQSQFPERKGLSSAFVTAAFHRRGIVAWVERAGQIRAGETVTVQIPEQFDYSHFLKPPEPAIHNSQG